MLCMSMEFTRKVKSPSRSAGLKRQAEAKFRDQRKEEEPEKVTQKVQPKDIRRNQ